VNGWKRMSPEYLVCNTYLPILFWFFADTSLLMSSLDASVIKTFSSGGDPITARQNYSDECTFRLQTTAIFFVNDMPKVRGQDQETENRLKFIETSYSYLNGDLYES